MVRLPLLDLGLVNRPLADVLDVVVRVVDVGDVDIDQVQTDLPQFRVDIGPDVLGE